jgi:hypothetical protein
MTLVLQWVPQVASAGVAPAAVVGPPGIREAAQARADGLIPADTPDDQLSAVYAAYLGAVAVDGAADQIEQIALAAGASAGQTAGADAGSSAGSAAGAAAGASAGAAAVAPAIADEVTARNLAIGSAVQSEAQAREAAIGPLAEKANAALPAASLGPELASKGLRTFIGLTTGASDNSAALAAAIATGAPLVAKQGDVYTFTSPVNLTNQSVDIDWNGATINIQGDFKWFSAKASFTNVQAISSIAQTSIDLANGTNASLTDVTVLTVPNASVYAAQDVIKILSDDQIIGTDPTKNRCRAEYATIAQVNGVANTITLFSRLRMAYSTNPRVAKMNRGVSIKMRNAIVRCSTVPGSTGVMDLIGLYRPVLENIDFRDLNERAVRLLSCYEPTTRDLQGNNLHTSVSANAFGYLVHEVACFGGRHWGLTGRDVRHVYACSANTVAGANSAFVENYGINYATKVIGGRGVNCKAAAFEAHDDGEDIDFMGCHAEGPYWGEDGNQTGFSLRGRRNRVINSTCYGGTGFRAFSDYASPDNSRDHSFINCQYTANIASQENHAFDVVGMSGGLVSGIQVVNPRVLGGADTSPHFEVTFGDMTIDGGRTLAPQAGATNQGRIYEANASATLRVKNHDVDYTGATATLLRLARLTSSSARIEIEGGKITDPTGVLSYFADFVGVSGTFYMGGPKGQNLTDMTRSIATTAAVTGLGGAPTYYLAYTVNWGRTAALLDRWTASWGAGATRTVDTANRGFPELFYVVTASAAGNSITDINPGAYDGQKLTVYNAVASTQPFTTVTGGNIELAATATVAVGGTITFRWSTSVSKWQKIT